MKKLLWMTLLTGCLAGHAQAALYVFDFEGISSPGVGTDISTYMTGVYGSTVTVTDARRHTGAGPWAGNGTDYIWTGDGPTAQGDMEILFVNTPITSLSVNAFVFRATEDPDFTVKAYDSTYGDVENPQASALVRSDSYSGLDDRTPINISGLTYARPVSLLVFSDNGEHDVGIDNLQVDPPAAPVPTAALLGLLGLGAAGVKLRRFA